MSSHLKPRTISPSMAKAAGQGKGVAVVAEGEGRRMHQIPAEGCDPAEVPDR